MKRIIIICEGQTEIRFCKEVLKPYFLSKNIVIEGRVIAKSNGGIVTWPSLKRQIENHLKEKEGFIVTTLLDFYGINDNHLFPDWDQAKLIPNKNDRLARLEKL